MSASKRRGPIAPEVIRLTGPQLDEIISLQDSQSPGWAAVFSCNRLGHAWPKVGPGFTPIEARSRVDGTVALLDAIVRRALDRRRHGGRLFFCEHGVWTKNPRTLEYWQVVEFVLESPSMLAPACFNHVKDPAGRAVPISEYDGGRVGQGRH